MPCAPEPSRGHKLLQSLFTHFFCLFHVSEKLRLCSVLPPLQVFWVPVPVGWLSHWALCGALTSQQPGGSWGLLLGFVPKRSLLLV